MTQLERALLRLESSCPVDEKWKLQPIYHDRAKIAGLDLNLVGLACGKDGGDEVTGSSVGGRQSALTRAYFEMVERTSLYESLALGLGGDIPLLDANGSFLRVAKVAEVFPASLDEGCWKYSLSNGVAVHRTFCQARDRALLELIERDALLRSWYFGERPENLKVPDSVLTRAIREFYELRLVRFQSISDSVVGLFGFARDPAQSAFFGFGASRCLRNAIRKAFRESFQRLAFTWGETSEGSTEHFLGTTATDHLEYYLNPIRTPLLTDWIEGKRISERVSAHSSYSFSEPRIFADLTPAPLRGKVSVIRAVHPQLMPLTFGLGHPWFPGDSRINRVPHPIA